MSHTPPPPPMPDSSLFSSSSPLPLAPVLVPVPDRVSPHPPTPDSSLFSSNSPHPPTPDSSLFSSSGSPSPSPSSLKMPEILATKLNYTGRVAKKMEKMFQNHANIQPFVSCFVLETIFFLYLFKKYKMNCVIKDVNAYKTSIGLIMKYDESEEEMHPDRFKHAIYPVARQMFQCIVRGDPIIIIPFTFTIKYDKKPSKGHANLLIYRRNAGHIEHFEPHGAEFGGEMFVFQGINYTLDLLLELLNGYIDSDNAKNASHMQHIKLIKASQICPSDGVQKIEGLSTISRNALIEPEGYCSAWTMFFTELCLKNPEIPSRQINDAIMNKAGLYHQERDYLRNVIRGYTYFINNKIATHFSYIFGEPVTTAKIHRFSDPTHPKVEIIAFMQKLSEILNEETGKNKSGRTAIKGRYAEFADRIRSETSSSSLEDRVSPPRKSPTHGLGIKKTAHKRASNKKRLSRKRINTPKKH